MARLTVSAIHATVSARGDPGRAIDLGVTSSATPPAPSEPKLLRGGRYALLRKLGEGSQGQTYEAMDQGTSPEDRERAARAAPLADKWARYVREQKSGGEVQKDARLVAIKCFRVDTAKAWKDVELAEREASTLASLDHPRLPRYYEHFEENGALYLVMEKIEGESLATLRAQRRTMSVADVTRMLEDIAEALQYLHGRAPLVVHRDIKPGNILRRPDGSFALVDFGAVRDRLKLAGGSTVVGTFGYMAPEQFQGRASPRSDVYGLGATAITMLTGVDPEELPHAGLGIDVAKALPASTPAPLLRALSAMLVPDPDRRAASIDEAIALLRAPPEATPSPAAASSATSTKYRESRASRDRPRDADGRFAPRSPRRALRNVDLSVIASAWLVVFFITRRGSGHHPIVTALVIAVAIMVTGYVQRMRRSPRRAARPDPRSAEAPKVRVAEEPKRVRAVVAEATTEDEEPSEARDPERAARRRRS